MRADDIKAQETERMLQDAIKDVKMDYVRLTIDELRSCKGFEAMSEAEANEIIESLFQLALIALNYKS